MPLQPIPIEVERRLEPVAGEFRLELEVFEGPLQLLLHLIELRRLDVLTVPLALVADAYLAHLATNPVDPRNLSEFVSIASQLILLKSRRLLPGETEPIATLADGDEADEEELRRRLVEYRALRDAALALGERESAPVYRREPRDGDLPELPVHPVAVERLADALEALAAIPEPQPPPAEVVAREVTIGQQMAVVVEALGASGQVWLGSILAACRSRTERVVTFIAALELIRRRQARAEQRTLFGPILIERLEGGA